MRRCCPCATAAQAPEIQFQSPTLNLGDSGYLQEYAADDKITSEEIVNAYWPEMNSLDVLFVKVRLAVFGSWQPGFWMGTDAMGRDVLSRIVWGSRTLDQGGADRVPVLAAHRRGLWRALRPVGRLGRQPDDAHRRHPLLDPFHLRRNPS
ncbi:MAG: hypothetical protein R3F17_17050 [Planctomycetota bacterium]